MKDCLITVDVYAHWGDRQPKYRVYVDNELMTERDFIWPGHEIYIKEHITVNLEPGVHSVDIEKISTHGTIIAKNVTVNGQASDTQFIITE